MAFVCCGAARGKLRVSARTSKIVPKVLAEMSNLLTRHIRVFRARVVITETAKACARSFLRFAAYLFSFASGSGPGLTASALRRKPVTFAGGRFTRQQP